LDDGRRSRRPAAFSKGKGAGLGPAPDLGFLVQFSGVENGDDLVGARIDHDDLTANDNVFIAAPFGVDRHDFRRKTVQRNALARHAGADRDREVHVRHRGDALVVDYGRDLGALLGGELGAGARLTCGLRTFGRALGLRRIGAALAVAALGLHVVPITIAAFGLHVVVAFAALGLHVAALFFGALVGGSAALFLGALGALFLHGARRLLLGLGGFHPALLMLGLGGFHSALLRRFGLCSARRIGSGRSRGSVGRGRVLRRVTAGLAALGALLRIGKAGAGNQGQRRDRNHETISHTNISSVSALPAPTTKGEIRCSCQNPVPPALFVERAMNSSAQ